MIEIFVTEEKDLSFFAHNRTIGVIFRGPTGLIDDRSEVDLTPDQVLALVNELAAFSGASVISSINAYPRPSYEDLIPPSLKQRAAAEFNPPASDRDWSYEPTVGELGIADPPQLTAADYSGERLSGAVSSDECCGGGCCG